VGAGRAIAARGTAAIIKHPVLSAAGAAGAVGLVVRALSTTLWAGAGGLMKGYHMSKHRGGHCPSEPHLVRNRRMNVAMVALLDAPCAVSRTLPRSTARWLVSFLRTGQKGGCTSGSVSTSKCSAENDACEVCDAEGPVCDECGCCKECCDCEEEEEDDDAAVHLESGPDSKPARFQSA